MIDPGRVQQRNSRMHPADDRRRRQVRAAINRIRPIGLSGGPNTVTVKVGCWSLSAPTAPELAQMLWRWFAREQPEKAT